MKTTKLIIGIISIILFAIVIFQSCVAGLGNALEENGEVSGTAGAMLAVCMLIAGIVGIATKSKPAGGFVTGAFYLIGGIIGIANVGSYGDLAIWSWVSFIFAAVVIIGSAVSVSKAKKAKAAAAAAPAESTGEAEK